MKVVFLDVDGELTYSSYRNPETDNIDLAKIQLIKELCECTDAKVVISSSWRLNDVWYEMLLQTLLSNDIEVIGKTSYIPPQCSGDVPDWIAETTLEDLPEFKIKYGTGRGAEIQQWLKEHDVDNFVILDDENWQWTDYGYENHWVQSSYFDGGLRRSHIQKAIEILNNYEKVQFMQTRY